MSSLNSELSGLAVAGEVRPLDDLPFMSLIRSASFSDDKHLSPGASRVSPRAWRTTRNSLDIILQVVRYLDPRRSEEGILEELLQIKERRSRPLWELTAYELIEQLMETRPVHHPLRFVEAPLPDRNYWNASNTADMASNKIYDTSTPENECTICFESMDNSTMLWLDCGHGFHDDCITAWCKMERSDCPFCRHHIKLRDEYPPLQ